MKKMHVKIRFTESILGTCPNNKDIYLDFIASKAPAPSEDVNKEAEMIQEDPEKQMTVFPRTEDGVPFLYDYQIKGFLKGACGGLRKVAGTESSKIKAFKKEIDLLIFPQPRIIPFKDYKEIGLLQRPLRASTPQGERISLAISEEIPAGASIEFDIVLLHDDHEDAVREWLDYGQFSGIGQWRNASHGRFVCEEITVE